MNDLRHWMTLLEGSDHPGFPEVTDDLAAEVIDQCMRFGFELDEPEDEDEELEAYVKSRLYGILDEISLGAVGDQLTIYRAIDVAGLKALNRSNLGIYWSTEPGTAHPYNGQHTDAPFLRLQATVALRYVDWVTTLALHLEGGENEVRLETGVPVTITAAHWVSHNAKRTPQPLTRLVGRVLRT